MSAKSLLTDFTKLRHVEKCKPTAALGTLLPLIRSQQE